MSDSYEHWLFAGHACVIPEPGDFFATPDFDPAFEAIEGWAEPIPPEHRNSTPECVPLG